MHHDFHGLQLFVPGDFSKDGKEELVKLGQESQLWSNVWLDFAHVCQVRGQECVYSILQYDETRIIFFMWCHVNDRF